MCQYTLLFAIIHDYVTIMARIAIIAIIALICYSRGLKSTFPGQNKHQGWATHRGYHVDEESQRLDDP